MLFIGKACPCFRDKFFTQKIFQNHIHIHPHSSDGKNFKREMNFKGNEYLGTNQTNQVRVNYFGKIF